MSRNMVQWVKDIIHSPVKKALPVLSFPAVRLMGITVEELIGSSELQAKGMAMVAERTDSAASVSLMDLSVEAEAFGSTIHFSEREVPTVVGRFIASEEEAESLKIPAVGTARTGLCLEAIRKAVEMIKDRPVLAGVIGPFSLAGRLMDVTEAMIYCFEEPDMVHTVLGKTTEFLIEYIRAFKEAGADGVVVAEPLSGLLSPELGKEFSTDYMKKIIDAVQDEQFIVVYHNCGNTTVHQAPDLAGLGCRAYHFGNAIQMKEIMDRMPEDALVMGNIDPAGEFLNGTPESVRRSVMTLLEEMKGYPNFVISSGCDIPPGAGWENIDAFFGAVNEYAAARPSQA